MPSKSIDMESPYERLYKKPPTYDHIRVFGSRCFPYLRDYSKNKFTKQTYLCVFIGCSSYHKGFRCLDSSINRVYISRHVIFDETIFPFDINKTNEVNSLGSLETTSFTDIDMWMKQEKRIKKTEVQVTGCSLQPSPRIFVEEVDPITNIIAQIEEGQEAAVDTTAQIEEGQEPTSNTLAGTADYTKEGLEHATDIVFPSQSQNSIVDEEMSIHQALKFPFRRNQKS